MLLEVLFMPITVYTSNRQEELAELLAGKLLNESSKSGIFHRLQIIVPNRGIARYLTLQLSRKNHIVMGLEFPYLMTFLLRHIGKVTGDVTDQSSDVHDPGSWEAMLNKESLAFHIFSLLDGLLLREEFILLKKYLGSSPSPGRKWQLASKLAELYDRYILLRPDWINDWEAGKTPGGLSGETAWQRILWQQIRQEQPEPHFAQLFQKIQSSEYRYSGKGTIRLFGFSSIPDPVLACLEKLDADVEIFHLSPCREYWGDAGSRKDDLKKFIHLWQAASEQKLALQDEDAYFSELENLFLSNNPMLGTFAAQGREFFVRSLDWITEPCFIETPETGPLLQKLQNAFLENTPPATGELPEADAPDLSIQIHNCYSAFREVETLHDFLLNRFAEDKTLNFNDVFIMTPQPERYAHLIEAVFHNPAHEGNMLKVSLADRSAAEKLQSARSFTALLKQYKECFKASEIMALLARPEICRTAGIADEELPILCNLVDKAGIRWGWDAADHQEFSGAAFPENSWRNGLDRMLWSYASLGKGDLSTDNGTVFGIRDAGADGELLGKFCRFIDELRQTIDFMKAAQSEPVSLPDWSRFLQERALFFLGEESALLPLLRSFLANLQRNAANAGCQTIRLETDVILSILQTMTDEVPDSSSEFLRGKITFCGLRPMRSIPAKIICLLGMDHDSFPRQNRPAGFDLIHQFPRTGDPVPTTDDYQLFIETILSARDILYFSYCGRDIRSNKEYPASSCLEELRLYLAETFGKKSWYEADEPLQAFSPQLFIPGNPAQSHSEVLCSCARTLLAPRASRNRMENCYDFSKISEISEISEENKMIHLNDLINFFSNPVAYFQKHVLNASVPFIRTSNLEDSEAFQVSENDFLLMKTVFEQRQTKPEISKQELLSQLQADGKMPLYPCFREEWQLWNDMDSLNKKIPANDPEELNSGRFEDGDILLMRPKFCLHEGTLYFPLYQNIDSCMYKYILYHVAVNLLRPNTQTCLIGKDSDVTLPPLADAQNRMKDILSLYRQGLQSPLLFFPKSSYAAVKPQKSGSKKTKTPQEKFFSTWNDYHYPEYKKFSKWFSPQFSNAELEEIIKNAKKFFGILLS